MSRNKKNSILLEHLVKELRSSQSGGRVNNYMHRVMESKRLMRDSEIGRFSVRVVQKNVLGGNSRKKRLSEPHNSRGRRVFDRSCTHHGMDDYKLRHSYNNNLKNHGSPRNNRNNFKSSTKSSRSNFSFGSGAEDSLNSGGTDIFTNNASSQLFNTGQNKSSARPIWPTPSQTAGNNKPCGNELGANEFKSNKSPAQSDTSQRLKRSASGTGVSKPQDAVSESKPKNEVSTRPEHGDGDRRPSSPTPGPSEGRRNISDRVISRIKADMKFQAKVKTIIAAGNPTVNKSLINENAEFEPSFEDSVGTDEEMDWETSEQEMMIEQIKAIRKSLSPSTNVSSEFALQSKNSFKILSDNVLLVVDTNVFISCLPFIKDIRDAFLPDLGLPNIFIPWVVLRELDHLKMTSSEQLAKSAMRAIRYINETFLSNHPRVTGQSFEDFCLMKNSACDCTDDEILNVCMHLRMFDSNRKIMLITNDRNLESKAIVSGVQAYSKQRFVDEVINRSTVPESEASHHNMMIVKYTLYPKLKIVMKIALEMVVESELKKAFGHNWLHIVIRKPPWNLIQVFDCFLRHWRSVFTFTFEKELYSEIESVRKMFMSEDHGPERGRKFSTLIQIGVDLLETVRHQISLKASSLSSPEYMKLADHLSSALHEIELLRQAETKLLQEQSSDVHMANSAPIEIEDITFGEPPVSGSELCKEEVKALFQIIWNQVESYCLRVTELVANCGVACPEVIEQVKCQFPEFMHKLQELIVNIEHIISLEPQELAHSGQLIMDFTNFLISLNILQTETVNVAVLLKNIGFFCCDDESRIVLHILVNDLKQFGNQIIDGMKCLGFI